MIRTELAKQWRRVRTLVAMGAIVVIPVLITVAFKVGGRPRGGQGDRDFFRVATSSGLDMAFTALAAMSGFMLVVVTALFAGESVAGEAGWGTLRYLLLRPVPRSRLLGSKVVVAALLTVVATVLVTGVGLAAGTAAFGWHPLTTPFLTTMSQSEAGWKLALATAYVAWDMACVVSFGIVLSVLTDATFGAVAGAVGLTIVSEILDGISAMGVVRYGLPTHYWDAWMKLFTPFSSSADMVRGALVQLGYVVVLGGFAFWWFRRKDILS